MQVDIRRANVGRGFRGFWVEGLSVKGRAGNCAEINFPMRRCSQCMCLFFIHNRTMLIQCDRSGPGNLCHVPCLGKVPVSMCPTFKYQND